VKRLLDAVVPARLGLNFRWLVAANWVSHAGDGMALAAGPLLVASQTNSPFLVALAAMLQRLPWLVFGLHAGVIADRVNRKTMVVLMDLIRIGIVGMLCVSIAAGQVNIAVVLAATFLTGVAEVFADSATGTLMPMLIEKPDLGIGGARMMFGYLTMNQMIGPPVGAALFGLGMQWPFMGQALCGGAAVWMISRIRLPTVVRSSESANVRQDLRDGLLFAWQNSPVRTLILSTVTFNLMLGAATSVLVLYATQRLQMSSVGFGLLTTAIAVGGVVGTVGYGWIEARAGVVNILRFGLLIETFTHLGFALTRQPGIAMALMFVLGAHSFVWSATSRAVRMRLVPTELQGRVGSIYMVGVFGTMALGQLVGGILAGRWGVTAPFWFGFLGCAVALTALWPKFHQVVRADALALRSAAEI